MVAPALGVVVPENVVARTAPPSSRHLDIDIDTELDPRIVATTLYNDAGAVEDFEYVSVNAAAAQYLGVSASELIGRRCRDVIPGVADSPWWPLLVRVAQTGETLVRHRFHYVDERRSEEHVLDLRVGCAGAVLAVSWRDVTDQSRLLTHYRLLAENASDAVFQLDEDLHITWASPSSATVLGWAPDELIGVDALELLHPDDRSKVAEWTIAVERENAIGVEARLRTKSGRYSYFAISLRAVAVDGDEVELIGSIRNVDDDVTNRASLNLLSSRYRLIAENSLDVVVVGDLDGRIRWVFDTVYQLLGWRPDQLVGRRTDELMHPDDVAEARAKRELMLAGERITTEVRIRQADGNYRWLAITGRDVPDETGVYTTRVVSWRDAEGAVAHRNAMAESEAQFRLLAENASDIVWRTDRDGLVEWVSPSVHDLLGWRPDELIGRPITDLNAEDDVANRNETRVRLLRGDTVAPFECRYRRADGGFRWMGTHFKTLLDSSGRVDAIVTALHDVTALVHGRRALNALAAGNAIVVRAANEADLLTQLCQNLVDEGGYLFAWYGRPVNDATQSVTVVASAKEHRSYVDPITISWGDNVLGQGPTGRSLRTGETFFVNHLTSSVNFAPWATSAASHGFRSAIGLPVFVDGFLDGAFSVYAPDENAFDVTTIATLEDLALQVGIGLQRLHERDRLALALRESNLLNTAIDQAMESVLITDPSTRILYANPATTVTSGYAIDELVGETPAIFSSGLHDRAFYQEMWGELNEGRSWHGVISNRRKNGDDYDEDTTISPVVGSDGAVIAYVAVKRDLSVERRLEADVIRGERDSQDVVNLMREIRPGDSLFETLSSFTAALLKLDFVDAAVVFLRQPGDVFTVAGAAGISLASLQPGRAVDVLDPSMFLARSATGAWWIDLADPGGFVDEPLVRGVRDVGVEAATFAPVHWNGDVIGILATGSRDRSSVAAAPSRLAIHEELGSFAGGLFGAQADATHRRDAVRASIRSTIEDRRFHAVFQPIVEFSSGLVVGFEALTRFDDGERPDHHFAAAAEVDMGADLEIACARGALSAAVHLPPEAWVSLNFSPSVVTRSDVTALISTTTRPIAVEITEHARIDDYDEIRRTIATNQQCRLFVDDAGAGYAGLHHILELLPDVVKLDISLVRDIDHDPARQALVSGMRHFADLTGTLLLGEGVETVEEAETLRSLGVDYGQGFLFGRPAPATSFVTTPGGRSPRR